jgi:hypothetical protein
MGYKGWFNEKHRHALAAKGIRTSLVSKSDKDILFKSFAQEQLDEPTYQAYERPMDIDEIDNVLADIQKKMGYYRAEPVSDDELALMLMNFQKSQLTGAVPMSLAAKRQHNRYALIDFGDFVKWSGAFLTGSIDDVVAINKGTLPVNGTGVNFAGKNKMQMVKEHKNIIKDFPGENPRMTEEFAHFRQQDPKKYDKFRTKQIGDKDFVYGHNKKSDKWELQSILIKR